MKTINLEAEDRVRRLLSLEPASVGDFDEVVRVLEREIERAQSEGRIAHSISLKRRLAQLRRARSLPRSP